MDSLRYYEPIAVWLGTLLVAYQIIQAMQHNKLLAKRRRYWPWIGALLVATAIAWGPVVFSHFGVLSKSTSSDLRLLPLAADSQFLRDVQPDTKETVWVFCYPFDPMSCNIALQYRDRFQGHWTAGLIKYAPTVEPDFKGINIVVADLFNPPLGASTIKKELWDRFGIDSEMRIAPDLKPNEFEVWIGGEP